MTSPVSSNAPAASFAGIGSGYDYTDLVNSIIATASQPANDMQARINAANAQLSAYQSYSQLLTTLEAATSGLRDGSAFGGVSTSVNGSATGATTVALSATAGAAPGSYAVQVQQTAQAEKLSGVTFADSTSALGLSGDFLINGKTITIAATDSLSAVRDKINAANSGSSPSGVTAAIVSDSSGAQRLVLTSQKTGATGIDLIDGTQGVAAQLGWIDGTTTLKHVTSAGDQSDQFTSATASIASLRGLTQAPGPQTVTIGGQSVSIDLSTDSLTSIAAKLSALNGIQATVQSTTVNGTTQYYLDVRNTTSFVDSGNTLQQLGFVKAGRGATAQQVQSSALTAGDGTTPATASTLLTQLWNGGSASNAQAGDTLNISGTNGDGTAVNFTFTIGAGSTVQDLLNALNDPTTGFGGGTNPATATIDANGKITLTDNAAGNSQLGLQIVSNNESGGRLDLGDFTTTTAGRARQLVAGADAKFSIDGVSYTRTTNSVSDVIANTTLTLTNADPTVTNVVTIGRSEDQAQQAVQSFVDAYNKVIDFIQQQQTVTQPTDGSTATPPPLYNDSVLRLARSTLSESMLTTVFGAATDMSTIDASGISLTKDGHLQFSTDTFQNAFNTRFTDLQDLFMEEGTTTNSSMIYASSTASTTPGTYDVNVTQAASQAQVLGTGFSGTYQDDGTPDTMTVTDPATNYSTQIQLTNGMTTADIVSALNTQFATGQNQTITTANVLNDASGTTAATTGTKLVDLHDASGMSSGVAIGDTIDLSGLGSDGSAYSASVTVDANTTIGDLTSRLQTAVGAGATVNFTNGQFVVTSNTAGTSSLSLNLTAHNEGGGSLDFGAGTVTTTGRGIMSITASSVNGQLQIQHNSYGSAPGLTIAFSGGGTDSTAQLGLSATTVHGTDVAGTIGGFPATGNGQILVGNSGTAVDGLSLSYTAAATGDVGNITLSEGVGAIVDRLVNSWTDSTTGLLTTKQTALQNQIATQQQRLDDFNARIAIQKNTLLQKYQAMDTAVAQLQSQGNAFLAALGSASSSASASAQ